MSDIRHFGTTAHGEAVQAVTLRGGELTARILTFGATLQDLRLAGTPWPLVLGADRLAAYEGPLIWCGAVVGPMANRLAGGLAVVGGRPWQAPPNDGPNLLHSGAEGTSNRVWQIEEASADALTLRLDLPHGAAHLPGNRVLRARYCLRPPATLEITLTATSDADTLMNLAHHPYWNLDGTASTAGHQLSVAAPRYLPVDAQNLPLPPQAVAATPHDLRSPRAVESLPPLDHNYCLSPESGPESGTESGTGLRPAARLCGAEGLCLTLETDAPGLQVYDGRALASAPFPGLTGQPYGPHAGLALEPQAWPNAPHQPGFPPVFLPAGRLWAQQSRLSFTRGTGTA